MNALQQLTARRPAPATARDDLQALVQATPVDALPQLVGDLATAQAAALARVVALHPKEPEPPGLVPLTEEWAASHGWQLETAMKLARSGRIRGAEPAPSRGRGRRRRWLVPATLPASMGAR